MPTLHYLNAKAWPTLFNKNTAYADLVVSWPSKNRGNSIVLMLVLEGVEELTPGAIDGSTEGAWSTIYECEPPNRSGYRRGTSRYDAIRETAYESTINKYRFSSSNGERVAYLVSMNENFVSFLSPRNTNCRTTRSDINILSFYNRILTRTV